MNFFGNRNGVSAAAKKPVIRKETSFTKVTTTVPVNRLVRPARPQKSRAAPPAGQYQPSCTSGSKASLSGHLPSRLKPQSSARSLKRKARQSTPQTPLLSEDDGSSGDDVDSGSDLSRKRIKSSVTSMDGGRRLGIAADKAAKDGGVFKMVHAADLTSGVNASNFHPPWNEEEITRVELQYPSHSQRECFELVFPHGTKSDDYKPFEDVIETINYVSLNYFPRERAIAYTDDTKGYERRLRRAFTRQSIEEFMAIIDEFNDVVVTGLQDRMIQSALDSKHALDLDWIKRILDQTYARTVSPKVETLRAYQNGSDNVYGELLPRFISDICKETKLTQDQIFVDLGSGVGNVVLQAALEVGCESWGCEMMPNPCTLAELQAKEFPARARLWGLSVGAIHLLKGDFLENREIGEVLKRADVVLVNNQAFGPELNSKLVDRFLDLKDGCQIVSLKSFVPDGHKMMERNIDNPINLFEVKPKDYWSESVSWMDHGGTYYIARKDPRRLVEFRRTLDRRLRRG